MRTTVTHTEVPGRPPKIAEVNREYEAVYLDPEGNAVVQTPGGLLGLLPGEFSVIVP